MQSVSKQWSPIKNDKLIKSNYKVQVFIFFIRFNRLYYFNYSLYYQKEQREIKVYDETDKLHTYNLTQKALPFSHKINKHYSTVIKTTLPFFSIYDYIYKPTKKGHNGSVNFPLLNGLSFLSSEAFSIVGKLLGTEDMK